MNNSNIENIIGAFALSISDKIQEIAQSESPSNISAAGLTLIGHEPGMTIHDLSLGLGLSHPGTVRLIDRMVAAALVERKPSKTDARAVALYLTSLGTLKERKILNMRGNLLQQAISVLTDSERQTMARITKKMLVKILRDEDHALSICRLCDSNACEQCPIDAELENRSNTTIQ